MSGNKKKSWMYDTTNKESRKKVKRLTNKIDRRESNIMMREIDINNFGEEYSIDDE